MPVYEKSLDDIFGVVYAQDLLHIADQDLLKRKVRELVRPALFVPETKSGSDLLREMRQRDQPVAIIIDEHGLVAGLATVEDLVEEIVGESGRHDRQPAPDVVRETDGGLVMRGSMSIDHVEELLGVQFGDKSDEAVTTIAGLLSHVSGKVPAPGDKIDLEGFRFEVLEANQRKVLRLRIRKKPTAAPTSAPAA
jgi:putative hemolysin